MSRELQRAYDYIDAVSAAKTLDAFGAITARTFENFGIPNYALAAMMQQTSGPRQFTALTRGVTEAWSQHYWDQKYFNVDAAIHLALQRPKAFTWSDVESQPLSKASAKLFHEIRDAMPVESGLVIPIHDAHGFAGIAALFCEGAEPNSEAAAALKLISLYGVERAKQLYQQDTMPTAPLCPLSQRQREILAYAAMGKSENDTADIIGISSATVREHIAKVRDAMSVRTKMQAVAIAVQRGWIAL